MTDRAAFLAGLRRRPYDRVTFNCWHAASLIQGELFGRALPLVEIEGLAFRDRVDAFRSHPERRAWCEISAPIDGAFVLMGRARGREHHCGVWLAEGGGRIWHGDEPHGVIDDFPLELAQSRRWRLSYHCPA